MSNDLRVKLTAVKAARSFNKADILVDVQTGDGDAVMRIRLAVDQDGRLYIPFTPWVTFRGEEIIKLLIRAEQTVLVDAPIIPSGDLACSGRTVYQKVSSEVKDLI